MSRNKRSAILYIAKGVREREIVSVLDGYKREILDERIDQPLVNEITSIDDEDGISVAQLKYEHIFEGIFRGKKRVFPLTDDGIIAIFNYGKKDAILGVYASEIGSEFILERIQNSIPSSSVNTANITPRVIRRLLRNDMVDISIGWWKDPRSVTAAEAHIKTTRNDPRVQELLRSANPIYVVYESRLLNRVVGISSRYSSVVFLMPATLKEFIDNILSTYL